MMNDYYSKIRETNYLHYWYNLANTHAREGRLKEALHTIDIALTFPAPYPSREVLLAMKSNIEPLLTRQMHAPLPFIIDTKYGDIDGDSLTDTVLLTGHQTADSPFIQDITVLIHNGRAGQYEQISLQNDAGYNPTLFLGDFTGNRVADILVVIDTGGSGGAIYAYIFSHLNGHMREVFNSDQFNASYQYDVNYENLYKASLTSHHENEQFIIDLTYKGTDYLNEVYDENGRLRSPVEGWVNPLSGLYPVDFNRDDTYELEAYQRAAGRYNADSLGYVITVLKWDGQRFVSERQNVAIFGEKL